MSRIVEGLRYYSTCQLTCLPATFSQMLAEDIISLGQRQRAFVIYSHVNCQNIINWTGFWSPGSHRVTHRGLNACTHGELCNRRETLSLHGGGGGGLVTKLCLTLCDLMDCCPPDSSVHGISQARILELVVIFFSRGSSQAMTQTWVSFLTGGLFTTEPPGKPDIEPQRPQSFKTG